MLTTQMRRAIGCSQGFGEQMQNMIQEPRYPRIKTLQR